MEEGNWSFIKAEMYNMPNILSNTLTLLSSYLKNSRTNISFLIFLSYQWYINAVFDRYDKI